VGIPAIFVPFFLVHDRLRALERTMMLEVEGGTKEWFLKLIRHEAAHAYNYAYSDPAKRKNGGPVFGRTSRDQTPDSYRLAHSAASFVVNLEDWYAQSHPDEDFGRRPLPSGSRLGSTGARVMLVGRRCKNLNTLMS